MVRQLSTSTKLQGFHYYQGRIQSTTCGCNIFSHTKTRQHHPKTLIIKVSFTMNQTGQKKFTRGVAPKPPKDLSMSAPALAYQPKPPLHGLSFSKFLNKNHTTLFWSGHQTESSKTRLHKAQHPLASRWPPLIPHRIPPWSKFWVQVYNPLLK